MVYIPNYKADYQPQLDTNVARVNSLAALITQIGTDVTSLKNAITVDQVDYSLITGAATTQPSPVPIPVFPKNSETYSRLLTANLTDFSYSANQGGRYIQQGFNNAVASAAFVYTVTAQTGETFETTDLGSVTSFTLANGETRTFVNNSTTNWKQI